MDAPTKGVSFEAPWTKSVTRLILLFHFHVTKSYDTIDNDKNVKNRNLRPFEM